jgi:iron complex transport system substrate-binding protein
MNRYILPISVLIAFIVGIVIAVFPAIGSAPEWNAKVPDWRPAPGKPGAKRVVALSTSAVELLYSMGAAERVVGVTDYVAWPDEAKEKPKCGGWTNPNFEIITENDPDLILIQGRHELVRKFAARRKVPILSLNSDTIENVFSDISSLGIALDMKAEAAALRARIRYGLELVSSTVEGRKRVKVLIVLGRIADSVRAISTCGGDSFISDIVNIAGGENIFADLKGYLTISREQLMKRAPEVIIEMRPGEELSEKRISEIRREFSAMSSLPAVRDWRIHVVTDPSALTAGARIQVVARILAEYLHPELDWNKIKSVDNFGR